MKTMDILNIKNATPEQESYLKKIGGYGYHRLDVELNLLCSIRANEIFCDLEKLHNAWQIAVVSNLMLNFKYE